LILVTVLKTELTKKSLNLEIPWIVEFAVEGILWIVNGDVPILPALGSIFKNP